jgi:hypothetical protein
MGIDAFFWSGGLPTAAVLDLANTPGLTIRLLANDSVLPALQQTYGPQTPKPRATAGTGGWRAGGPRHQKTSPGLSLAPWESHFGSKRLHVKLSTK